MRFRIFRCQESKLLSMHPVNHFYAKEWLNSARPENLLALCLFGTHKILVRIMKRTAKVSGRAMHPRLVGW